MIKFNLDLSSLDSWLDDKVRNNDDLVANIIRESADNIYTEIWFTHPIKTWDTLKGIRKDIRRKKAEIYSESDISVFLEEGTKEHMIRPVQAKVLSFNWFYSKGHMVGGIKAKHIFENALNKYLIGRVWERIIDTELNKVF